MYQMSNPRQLTLINRKLKAVDFLGIFLALAGMTVVILGLTWGGQEYAWDSAQVIATLVVGTAVSVVFMLWQWKGPRYPLIPCKNTPLCIWDTLY